MPEHSLGSSRPAGDRLSASALPSPLPAWAPFDRRLASAPFGDAAAPLVAAATPLLDLIGRLSQSNEAPNLSALRAGVVEHLHRLERDLVASGAPADQVEDAHYLVCAAIDDVVLAARWRGDSVWAHYGMARTFHQDATAGDRFYDIVSRREVDPRANHDCLLLAYFCLALGFQGRLRGHPQGAAEARRVQDDLYRRLDSAPPGELSRQWRGVAVADRPAPLSRPALVGCGAAALAALAGLFLVLNGAIERRADLIVEGFASAPPRLPATIRLAPMTVTQRIARFLAPDVKSGLVAVSDIDVGTLVRIRNQGVFGSGSADIDPHFQPLIDRIGQAVGREKAKLLVIGYADNQPIGTARFRSSVELSRARAQAVAAALAQRADPASIKAEGRAADQPLESNDAEKGREANRRTDIQVMWRDAGAKP
jgi:type VI secretion system protein ImpK